MKITEPSELREGARYKYKSHGVGLWGWAYKDSEWDWRLVGGTGTGIIITSREEFCDDITDVESYEGLMAMKEGGVLVDSDGGLAEVVFCNEYIFGRRYAGSDDIHFYTYDTAKKYGWKLKDEQPADEAVIGEPID